MGPVDGFTTGLVGMSLPTLRACSLNISIGARGIVGTGNPRSPSNNCFTLAFAGLLSRGKSG